MKRGTVIAKCLVNSGLFSRLEDAEYRVLGVFQNEFPQTDYRAWNEEINDEAASDIISNIGRASRINIRLFILDLAS